MRSHTLNGWRRGTWFSLASTCAALIVGASIATPCRAQATLPGVEYREKWSAGAWEGAAMYVDGRFSACDAHFRPAPAQYLSLDFNGRMKSRGLIIDTDRVDLDAFFKGRPERKSASVSIDGARRAVPVVQSGKTHFALDLDDETLGAVARGGRFSFEVPKGARFSTDLPAETATAVANWRKCIGDHADAT